MIQELQLRILPEQAASEQSIAAYVALEQGINLGSVKCVRVLKRSIDARQRTVMVNVKVRLYIDEFPQDDEFPCIEYGDVSGKPRAVVVGAGPAGLFAALRLIELGVCPVVVERQPFLLWLFTAFALAASRNAWLRLRLLLKAWARCSPQPCS